jgi:hypothetical protein
LKKVSILLLIISTILTLPLETHAQPEVKCPNINELAVTSINDKQELINALNTIVPQIYEATEFGQTHKEYYSKWEIITALPFPKTVGRKRDENYYGMAKNFCGKEVADRSWLVRLYFPKFEGESASALEGQLFIAKSKEKSWIVWFRYH